MSNEITTQNAFEAPAPIMQTAPADNILNNLSEKLDLAKAVQNCSFLPAPLRGDPGNAFLAIELASRTGLPLMATLQGMYVIEGKDGRPVGKPGFYANFIHALIRKSGKFIDDYYEEGVDGTHAGKPNHTCRLVAIKQDGTEVKGPTVSLEMAARAGWTSRNGAIWNAYQQVMLQNRAVSFFARQICPELIFGIDPDGDRILDLNTPAEEETDLAERFSKYARPAAIVETEVFKKAKETAEDKPKRRAPKRKAKEEEPAPETDSEAKPFSYFRDAIDAAGDRTELYSIGIEIDSDFGGAPEEKQALRSQYSRRWNELKA